MEQPRSSATGQYVKRKRNFDKNASAMHLRNAACSKRGKNLTKGQAGLDKCRSKANGGQKPYAKRTIRVS